MEILQDALEEPYLDFAFRVTNVRAIPNTPAQRMDVKLTFQAKALGHRPAQRCHPRARRPSRS